MAGKNLKVALQVQADLNQAKREISSLKDTIQDTTKAADAATASQGKTSKAVAITADEVKKLSGATNLKDGIKQVSDYENWLGKTSVASKNVADSNKLIEKSITSLTPHLTALVGLSGGFIAIAVDTLNKAAELQNLSSVTGMNVEEFQYSAAAAKKVGIEVDKLSQIFQDSRDKVGDYLAEGGGELQQFFDEIAPKVGVTAKQFEKLNGDQILQLYVKTLQEAGVSQNEMVTHMERMASDSTRLIPIYENNAAALKKYGDAAKESGAILSQELVDNAKKAKSALGDFQMGVEGVTNKLVANAAPAIVFVAENLDVLVRAGLIVASVFAGKMITSTAATALAFITARYEAIKYQLSLTGVSSVATTTAARLTALSTVSRLLTAAGGLPGLAIAAAGVAASFLLMPSSAEAATDSLDNQSKTVAELAEEYKKLDQAQQRIAVRDAVQKQEELTQAYKNQQSELASLIEMGTRSSDVSDEQRQKALELVESYKSGKISANQLTAEYQKLTTVKASFRARADEVVVATNNAKQAMDKQNLVVDVYTGKADAAALASNGLSGDLNNVGTSADNAAVKVAGLNKAFTDYLKKTKEGIASNRMQSVLMDKFNFSEAQAKAVTEARLAKGDISDRSLDLTVKEQNLILAGVKEEEDRNKVVQDRQKLEKENTKEKEKQYAEGLQNIDSDITPKMQVLIDMARELALQMGDAFSVEKIDSLEAGLNKVDASLKQFLPTADQLNERIAGGLTDAVLDWADRRAFAMQPLSVFKLSMPHRGIESIVLRSVKVEHNNITNGEITVTTIQDVFGLPSTNFIKDQPSLHQPPNLTALAARDQRLFEVPFMHLLDDFSPEQLNYLNASYVMPLATAPNQLHLGFQMLANTVNGYVEAGENGFVWCSPIHAVIEKTIAPIVVALERPLLDDIEVGQCCLLNNEILHIDAIDRLNNSLTLARGCGDTVPHQHAAEDVLWIYEGANVAEIELLDAQTANFKLLPFTSSNVFAAAEASILPITATLRHQRPYPPADVLVNGLSYPAQVDGSLILSWKHRNRIAQGSNVIAYDDAYNALENDVEYVLEVLDANDNLVSSTNISAVNTINVDYSAVTTAVCKIRLYSIRDGLASYQAFEHSVVASFNPPYNLQGVWNEDDKTVELTWEFD